MAGPNTKAGNLGILAALAAAAVTSGIAVTVDRFQWEVELTLWLQGFSLGPFDFLRGLLFWMGVRGVAGAVMLAVCVVLWLRRWRLESAFVALALVPDLLNLVIKEAIARPRPTEDLVDVTIGWGGLQGFGFPSGHAVHAVVFYGLLLYLALAVRAEQAAGAGDRSGGGRVRSADRSVAPVRGAALAAGRAGGLRVRGGLPADAHLGVRAGAGPPALRRQRARTSQPFRLS